MKNQKTTKELPAFFLTIFGENCRYFININVYSHEKVLLHFADLRLSASGRSYL
jgi:hypothetical protein